MPAALKAIQRHLSLSLLIFPIVIASNQFYFPIFSTHPHLLHWYQISFPPSYLLEKMEANTSVFTLNIFDIYGWEPFSGYSILRLIMPGEKVNWDAASVGYDHGAPNQLSHQFRHPFSSVYMLPHRGMDYFHLFSNIWIMFPQMSDSPRQFFHKS